MLILKKESSKDVDMCEIFVRMDSSHECCDQQRRALKRQSVYKRSEILLLR